MNHCPLSILPSSPKLCTCLYIKNIIIMWNGGLLTSREPCCRDQKTKIRVVVDIIFCTEINRFRQLMKHMCMQIDNLHKITLNLHREGYFLIILLFVHIFVFLKRDSSKNISLHFSCAFQKYHSFLFTFWCLLLTTSTIKILEYNVCTRIHPNFEIYHKIVQNNNHRLENCN